MRWGGQEQGIHLSNTCPIDNGLTILHMFWIQNKSFRNALKEHTSEVFKTLASVMMLITEEKFSAAKLIWTGYVKPSTEKTEARSKDLFGDEYELLLQHICKEWVSDTVSMCDQTECPVPIQHTKQKPGGITIGLMGRIGSTQNLIDRWLDSYIPCNSQTYPDYPESEHPCIGLRHVKRHVLTAPILVVRVYEHCLHDNLGLEQIINTPYVTIRGKVFHLAGVTLFKEAHYCAIVLYNDLTYWYDGLKGRLEKLSNVQAVDNWFQAM